MVNLRSFRSRHILPAFFFTLLLGAFVLFFVLPLRSSHSPMLQLCINEISVTGIASQTGVSDPSEDYIELYNPTDEPLSLSGVYLSDNPKKHRLAALPDIEIPAGGFLVFYALGADGTAPEDALSVPFSLRTGETVTLTWVQESEGGTSISHLIDTVSLPTSLRTGAVYARTRDGGADFEEMRPSPGSSNEEAGLVLNEPTLSLPSGFYQGSISLSMEADQDCVIRYTLDGSEPDMDSPEYTESLLLSDPSDRPDLYASRTDISEEDSGYLAPESPVDKAIVLRAAAFDADGNRSNSVTATYFIDFDSKDDYEDAAILSLVTDPDNLFSDQDGIYIRGALYDDAIDAGLIYNGLPWSYLTDYTNYYQEGRNSERLAHIQLFDAAGSETLSQNCGIRIRGNESRHFPQKSFTLFARGAYGSSSFDPVLLGTGISYPNLILNNTHTLKKVFFFSLVEDRDVATQQYMPCQVFLNGEYWGMYYLMEKYSSDYLAGHYDVDAEDTLLIKDTRYVEDGDPEAIANFRELRDFLEEEDLSDPAIYQELLTKMDMQSFLDWMCTNIYIGNTDTKPLGGNVLTWQTLSAENDEEGDGRFRWMLYDLDDSLGVGTDLAATPAYAFDSFTGHSAYSELGLLDDEPMPALMENEDFRRQFVLTFLDMANENFRWERVEALLDKAQEQKGWADKSWERWNTNPEYTTFDEQVAELRTFFSKRFDFIVPLLAEHFGLSGDLVDVTLTSLPDEQGSISLNTLSPDLSAGDWTGQYYTDYPLTLKAEAAKGYSFVRWEIDGGEIADGDLENPEISVKLNDDIRITAVFDKN